MFLGNKDTSSIHVALAKRTMSGSVNRPSIRVKNRGKHGYCSLPVEFGRGSEVKDRYAHPIRTQEYRRYSSIGLPIYKIVNSAVSRSLQSITIVS